MKIRARHLVVPAYLLLSLAFTWPLAAEFNRSLPCVFGPVDALLQSFLLGWDYHALGHDPAGIWSPPIFHPEPRTLTYMDHLIGETIVAAPVIVATGNLATAYNVLVILSFVMSGWAVYRLVRFLGLSRPAAFLAGFLFTFSPYRFSNLGLLNQIQTQFIPLGLLFALRFLRQRRLRDLVATAATFLVQAWFGWYYAFHLVLALALLGIYELAGGASDRRDIPWKRMVLIAAATVLLVLPVTVPYMEQQRSMPSFKRSLGLTALYSADLLDYIKVNMENRVGGLLPALRSYQGYWPGLVSVVLSVVAIAGLSRGGLPAGLPGARPTRSADNTPMPPTSWISIRLVRRFMASFRSWSARMNVWGYFSLLGIMGFVLSLGPVLQVAGRVLLIPLPYCVAYFVVPGFASMRAPGRFAGLVALAAAVLAALGYHLLERRLQRSPGRQRMLFAGLFGIAAVAAWSVPVPLTVLPQPETMPEAYHWIASRPGDFALLELPAPATESVEGVTDAIRQIYVLYHGKARLDGVSGFVPPRYHAFRQVIQRFPAPETLEEARGLGARYILFHYGDLSAQRAALIRQKAGETKDLTVVAEFGDDVIYELGDRD